jgi:hypothetical protein
MVFKELQIIFNKDISMNEIYLNIKILSVFEPMIEMRECIINLFFMSLSNFDVGHE